MTVYEQVYADFWKPILEKDGQLSMDQLKRELYDFWVAMENVPKVYCHITGNLLSKINYDAQVVISAADDSYNQVAKENIDAAIDECAGVVTSYLASYPEDIFLPPPAGQHSQTVDGCAAAALRAILPSIIKDIEAIKG